MLHALGLRVGHFGILVIFELFSVNAQDSLRKRIPSFAHKPGWSVKFPPPVMGV